VNWIVVDDQKSSSLIKGINLGILAPGVSTVKTLHLFNTGAGGDRAVDVSVQTRTIAPKPEHEDEDDDEEGDDEEEEEETATADDTMEHLKLLVVPTVNPIQASHDVTYRRGLDPWAGLADLATFEESTWDNSRGGDALISVTMACVGPWSLMIESMELEKKVSTE